MDWEGAGVGNVLRNVHGRYMHLVAPHSGVWLDFGRPPRARGLPPLHVCSVASLKKHAAGAVKISNPCPFFITKVCESAVCFIDLHVCVWRQVVRKRKIVSTKE